MTRRVSRDHYEGVDWDDDRTPGCINLRLTEELPEADDRVEKNSLRAVAQEFPMLSPLLQ